MIFIDHQVSSPTTSAVDLWLGRFIYIDFCAFAIGEKILYKQ